ncbi:MAG TPA: ATP-binding cassette domain-containing protein [Gaiellaceae bacterium]|nr:ATP-binding cassette domain-containing protein [Gaiellaceae bacterium]
MRPLFVDAGTVLYREGAPATRFFLLESGAVTRTGAGVETLGPGETFGDAVLWSGRTFRTTATATSHCALWVLDAVELTRAREQHRSLDQALQELRPGVETPAEVGLAERGVRIQLRNLSKLVRGGRQVLHDVGFTVEPGELVALAGGSGAGKSTLLDAIAGVRPADEGTVLYDGVDYYRNLAAYRSSFGYVPQDDIIHRELSLRSTLRYSAELRLRAGTRRAELERVVADVLDVLDLTERADVRVGALSGGQRKRASIAAELLTRPDVFFLDEPTSGLDPATGAELMRQLRRLADSGRTVVMTTHTPDDIAICDKVVFLARDGHLAFVGTPEQARRYFDVEAYEEVYERLAAEATPERWGQRFAAASELAIADELRAGEQSVPPAARPSAGPLAQWWTLTRRNVEILLRNRLTLAIVLGSPLLVVAMLAVLFQPGAFDFAEPSPSATVMILFWVAFGGFFFGITYGLLQICTELPIVRRERLVNLRIVPYVLSKVAVLMPLLLLVTVAMLGILRAADRLPPAGLGTYSSLTVTLLLDAAAALALGLLASAAVTDPTQATLALPMLCFPAVLFSGAILSVPLMPTVGKVISYPMPTRWAFEGLTHDLGLNRLFAEGGSDLGPPLLAQYGDSFSQAVWIDWAIMGGMLALLLAGACGVLARKCRTAGS